jgi:hypothetical protein
VWAELVMFMQCDAREGWVDVEAAVVLAPEFVHEEINTRPFSASISCDTLGIFAVRAL